MVKSNNLIFVTPHYYVFVFVGVLLSCAEKASDEGMKPKRISDPYTESFWSKDIKVMLKENPLGGYDTVTFDRFGNMVEIQSLGSAFMKAEFDNNHFLTHHRVGGDLPEHNVVTYSGDNNIIIQKWVRIMTNQWQYGPNDVNQIKTAYSVFVFGEDSSLLKEVNMKNNFIMSYNYKDGLLSQRDKYSLIVEAVSESYRYFYENKQIKRIEEYYYGDHQNVPNIIHYFNDGTLDSTQRLSPEGKVNHTEKYRYIYLD